MVNARIRKSWVHNELDVAVIGSKIDLTYEYEHLGDSVNVSSNIDICIYLFSHISLEVKMI